MFFVDMELMKHLFDVAHDGYLVLAKSTEDSYQVVDEVRSD